MRFAPDPIKVKAAISDGMSAVCATCQKYWQAREKGVPGHRCLSREGCASPLGGGDFHEYAGPIQVFDRQCFVCGGPVKFVARAGRSVRPIGICDKHIGMFERLAPRNRRPPKTPDFWAVNGVPVPDSLLRAPKKKTLAESIYEVEKHYADKEGRPMWE